jgi:acyl-CoA synthetase (AMP-forming)/AMP-acid ligase II
MIFSPNSLFFPIAMHGLIAAGLRATLANGSYTVPELLHQLKDSGAHYIFAHPKCLPTVTAALKQLNLDETHAKRRVIIMDDNGETRKLKSEGWIILDDLCSGGKLEEEENFDGELANETVLLCYSSGTTGLSKGVETTHYNLTSVLKMFDIVFQRFGDINNGWIGLLPFYHIYGCFMALLIPLFLGVPLIVLPAYSPDAFCRAIERYKISFAPIVPPIVVSLLSNPALEKYDLRSLKGLVSGAAPLGNDLIHRFKQRLAGLGVNCEITQGYGLTETSPLCIIIAPQDAERKIGTCGQLLPNLEARIVDPDGCDVEEGQPGELWVRGPNIMKGYWKNKAATNNALTEDRWFKTGDVVVRDSEGFYTVVDRVKELIKYKGYQVPPAELEALLLQHPNIADVGVIGVYVPEQATELPRAYVVVKGGGRLMKTEANRQNFEQSVQKWVEKRVTKHKYLRGGVSVIDAIPKSAAGKILRRELRELAKKELLTTSIRPRL